MRTTLVGVDDALGHEVAELAGLRIEALDVGVILKDLADHDGAVLASIDGDLAVLSAFLTMSMPAF